MHIVHFQHIAECGIQQQGVGGSSPARPQSNHIATGLRLHHRAQLVCKRVAQGSQGAAQPIDQQQRGALPGGGIHRPLQAPGKLFGKAGSRRGHRAMRSRCRPATAGLGGGNGNRVKGA